MHLKCFVWTDRKSIEQPVWVTTQTAVLQNQNQWGAHLEEIMWNHVHLLLQKDCSSLVQLSGDRSDLGWRLGPVDLGTQSAHPGLPRLAPLQTRCLTLHLGCQFTGQLLCRRSHVVLKSLRGWLLWSHHDVQRVTWTSLCAKIESFFKCLLFANQQTRTQHRAHRTQTKWWGEWGLISRKQLHCQKWVLNEMLLFFNARHLLILHSTDALDLTKTHVPVCNVEQQPTTIHSIIREWSTPMNGWPMMRWANSCSQWRSWPWQGCEDPEQCRSTNHQKHLQLPSQKHGQSWRLLLWCDCWTPHLFLCTLLPWKHAQFYRQHPLWPTHFLFVCWFCCHCQWCLLQQTEEVVVGGGEHSHNDEMIHP